LTLNTNQTANLTVQFGPTAAGSNAGQLTLASNSSGGSTTNVTLSGSGVPVLSALSCATSSYTGGGTDNCTVTLNTAAASGGLTVTLGSSSSSVTVPSTVTVASGATTAAFTATVAAVSTSQSATITATAGNVAQTFSLQLTDAVATLTVNATTISFGDVIILVPVTQTVTLSSTGTEAVTVNSATLSGTGFTLSGATFPLTIDPGQSVTLTVLLDLLSTGAASGQLTIVSDSSTNNTVIIPLSANGDPLEATLTWDSPNSSSDPVAGYNVFRSPIGGSSYEQVNTSVVTDTDYIDTSISTGQSYQYVVESVDENGVESSPTTPATVTVP
jgi:hypothetical protein